MLEKACWKNWHTHFAHVSDRKNRIEHLSLSPVFFPFHSKKNVNLTTSGEVKNLPKLLNKPGPNRHRLFLIFHKIYLNFTLKPESHRLTEWTQESLRRYVDPEKKGPFRSTEYSYERNRPWRWCSARLLDRRREEFSPEQQMSSHAHGEWKKSLEHTPNRVGSFTTVPSFPPTKRNEMFDCRTNKDSTRTFFQ